MHFKLVVAFSTALLALVGAQGDQEGEYFPNPKFQYPKFTPEAPEEPEYPEFKEGDVYKFQEPTYPPPPEFPTYVYPGTVGQPEVVTEPQVEVTKKEKKEGDYTPHDSKMEEEKKKKEKKEGDYTPHVEEEEKKEKKEGDYTPHVEEEEKKGKKEGDYTPHVEEEEKKEGDYTPHVEEEEKKEGDYTTHVEEEEEKEKKEGDYTHHVEEEEVEETTGVPVFNYFQYSLPKIEEHNFDNFEFKPTAYEPEDKNATDEDYFKIQASNQVPETRSYQPAYDYYPSGYPLPSAYTPHRRVQYNPVPAPVYPHGQPTAQYPQQQATAKYPQQQPTAKFPSQQSKPAYVPQPSGPYPAQYPSQQGKPVYVPQPSGPYPARFPTYLAYQPTTGNHVYKNTVQGEGSYYRLDTCEYRFILDMVQCHQEERYSESVNVQSSGQGSHYQGQGPYYSNNYYQPAGHYRGHGKFPYQAPYDSRYVDFMRLYGNPLYYVNHHTGQSYKPGHFDDSLFSYSPSVGHPFYAPGLHNTPFAKYYAGFRAGQFEQGQEAETRQYHKEGHYQAAVQDFNNLKLQNVVKLDSEAESSVKTSSKVSVADEVGYQGVTPSFNYQVRLLPNHCTVPGYDGRHTCIVFSGATHPYRMVHRQFVYLKNSREVQGRYRFRYENGQRVQY